MVYAQFYFITEIPGFPVKQNKNMNFVFVDIFSSSSLDRPGEQNPKKYHFSESSRTHYLQTISDILFRTFNF